MLSDHYSFPIEDLRQHEPRAADVEWRAARASLQNGEIHEQVENTCDPEKAQGTRKRFTWFSARRLRARKL